MFIDRAKIYLQAGKGGDGSVSFRREKYVEFGGPDGGNGGNGGSIYFVSKDGISTLSDYRHAIKVKAEDGDNGHKKNSFGRKGQDIYLVVPTGTVIYDENNTILADLNKPGMEFLACKGGKGGRGNKCFVSSTNRAPKIAENGQLGEKKTLILELKLIADTGLVGLPSVGKSTFVSVVSNAKPKIAEYHFTTLEPMLGTVKLPSGEDFVIADLPGLIQGASQGKGLGFVFLRHVERCKVLIHIVDLNYPEGEPFDNFEKINRELETYNPELIKRPMVIALNKMDELDSNKKAETFKNKLNEKYPNKYEVFEISAINKQGLLPLLRSVYQLIKTSQPINLYTNNSSDEVNYTYVKKDKAPFKIFKKSDNHYEIIGDEVIKKYRSINIKTDEGMMKLTSYLNSIGINEELKRIGAKDGSTINLDGFEFEYYDID